MKRVHSIYKKTIAFFALRFVAAVMLMDIFSYCILYMHGGLISERRFVVNKLTIQMN